MNDTNIIPIEPIQNKILIIRNIKVILDSDLAAIFQVSTKALNQAVKRNTARFPSEFIFQLSKEEKSEVVTNCDHLSAIKYSHKLPYAFTEHGVAMLSMILKSERAIHMGVYIVRAFIKLRELIISNNELAKKIGAIEQKQHNLGEHIRVIDGILKHLIDKPKISDPIGFTRE